MGRHGDKHLTVGGRPALGVQCHASMFNMLKIMFRNCEVVAVSNRAFSAELCLKGGYYVPTQADTLLPLILVAHRERNTAALLLSLLQAEGYSVLCATNGRSAAQLVHRHQPSLLLLDQALPLHDGLALCRDLRQAGNDAAIFITSDRPDELNKLLAFNAGADDYLALPVHPRELLGRVKATLRRTGREAPQQALRAGLIVLDLERREAHAAGIPLTLTSLEYELLAAFVHHPGRVFTREELLQHLAGFLRGEPFDRTVDVHVSNLRRKLHAAIGAAGISEASPLETVRGVGYRLRADSRPAALSHGAVRAGVGRDVGRLALAALERAPVPLLVLAADRTVLLYNDAAEQLCGWKAAEVVGQVTCYSLLGCHDEGSTLLCHDRCVLRGGALASLRDQQAHYRITCKDGRDLAVEAHYSRLEIDGSETNCTLLFLRPVMV